MPVRLRREGTSGEHSSCQKTPRSGSCSYALTCVSCTRKQLKQYAEFERRLVAKLHAREKGGSSAASTSSTVGRNIGSFVRGVVSSVTETEHRGFVIAATIGAAALTVALFALSQSRRR